MKDILQITYKDQLFTLQELIEDNNAFSTELKRFDYKSHGSIVFMNDIGYLIANEKIEQLSGLISTARFALIEAHKKLHKSPVEWRSGYLGQIWLRSQYLKNAIVWYNSVLDYIYQIVWFSFDFYKSVTTKADYDKELRTCSWNELTKVHKKYDNENLKILYSALLEVKNNKHVIQINRWANSLKHHGTLNFIELQSEQYYTISFEGGLNNQDITGEVIDLDQACLVLKDGHQKFLELITFLISFIDFDKMFTLDENGNHRIDSKEKIEYKKIII